MKNELFLEKKVGKSGKEYVSLFIDLGYKMLPISFNDGDIAALCGITIEEVYNRKVGDKPVLVAKLSKVEK